MATSVTTEAHGVRVLTHIIPLEGPESVQCPNENKDSKAIPEAPYMTRMFLKGEPVALGTVQILIGMVMMVLGAVGLFTQTLYGEIPLGLGLSFIFSGSITLGARKGTCPPLIKSTIALNIISLLLAMSGICYFCFALAVTPDLRDCNENPSDNYYSDCRFARRRLQALIIGLKAVLLILSTLEVCVCTTLVVFSCKASRKASVTQMEVMVQGTERYTSHEALLKEASPPAYEP